MKKTYLFILGRQPKLASAEILSRLRTDYPQEGAWRLQSVSGDALVVDFAPNVDVEALFLKLGGSVKLGQVISRLNMEQSDAKLSDCVLEQLKQEWSGEGKLLFGISLHGGAIASGVRDLPREVKKNLTVQGISCRFVEPAPASPLALSSAQALKTGLLRKGQEILLVFDGDKTWLAKTVQVQEFEEFAQRDFGKPSRRIDPGLIPPKLGRMILNLAGVPAGGDILEPFCGSGVILVEGLLLGYRMTGNDLAEEAVRASHSNLKWLRKRYDDLPQCEINQGDASNLVERFGPFSFDAAVAEGDLGPIFNRPPTKKDTNWLVKRYRKLYTTVFAELRSTVRPGGRVILGLPRWSLKEGSTVSLNLQAQARLMGYRTVNFFDGCEDRVPAEWVDEPIVYKRPGQRTAREIYCLQA